MSDVVAKAVAELAQKFAGSDFGGTVKFEIEGEGSVFVDGESVEAADKEAAVTITASQDVFQDLMAGQLDPTSAYMSGKLKIDGDMGAAMKLASILS